MARVHHFDRFCFHAADHVDGKHDAGAYVATTFLSHVTTERQEPHIA